MAYTTLENTILANAALLAFRDYVQPLNSLSMVTSLEPGVRGDKVKVPFYSSGSAVTWNPSVGYGTPVAGNATGKDVTIDQRLFVPFDVQSQEYSNLPQLQKEQMARVSGEALAAAVMANIMGVITVANYAGDEVIGAASAFDIDGLIDIRTACNVLKFPHTSRYVSLGADFGGGLMKSVKAANILGDQSGIRGGHFGPLVGFNNVFEINNIPANGESLIGFANHPDAILVAMRPVTPPEVANRTVSVTVVSDPESQVVLQVRNWFDEQLDTERNTIECTFGKAVGNGAALIRFTIA